MRELFRWSSKWWPGLIPLAVLWVLASWFSTVAVEASITDRVTTSLKETVLDKIRLSVAGRDVTFVAEAFSEDGRASAVAAVQAVPGVRLVNDKTRLIPEVKPFIWSAERDVVRVTLGGNAPLPASKTKLMDAARASLKDIDVADRMDLARGAPAQFDQVALLLINQVSKLKVGKVSLSETQISLSGEAREVGGRETIAAALRTLPLGFTVANNDIKAAPYVFQAYKDPVASTVTLTGNVPDDGAHAAIVAAAGRKFFNEKVVDNLKTSVGAPVRFADAAAVALGGLSRLSTGTLMMSDREVRLQGDALYDAEPNQVRFALARDLPQGWQSRTEMSVKPAAAQVDSTVCQQLFKDLLGKAQIRFQNRSAVIDPDSAGLLDRLIETSARCPNTAVEVAAHTDADGNDTSNQTLTQKRAQAVVDILVNAGLSPERFQAVGFGGTQPVGDNDTDEGKVQNRRIEFVVK